MSLVPSKGIAMWKTSKSAIGEKKNAAVRLNKLKINERRINTALRECY